MALELIKLASIQDDMCQIWVQVENTIGTVGETRAIVLHNQLPSGTVYCKATHADGQSIFDGILPSSPTPTTRNIPNPRRIVLDEEGQNWPIIKLSIVN